MSACRQILLNVILHAVVIGIWLAVHLAVKPYESGFYCDDEKIGAILKPYKEGSPKMDTLKMDSFQITIKIFYQVDTVSKLSLYCFGLLTPLALIALVEFYVPYLNAKSEERSLKNVMSAICTIYFLYSFSAWTVNLLTEIIKVRKGGNVGTITISNYL